MRVRTFGSLTASSFLLLCLVVVSWLPAAEDEVVPGLTLTLRGHREAVYGIVFTADGKQIVTATGDPSIKVWQADTGKAFKTFAGTSGHIGLVLALALSPDGTQIASGSADNSLRIWDFPTSKFTRAFALATDARSVAVSPDGKHAAGGSKDGVIRVWTTSDGEQLHEMTGHAGAVTGLAFSPNGQTIASVGHDGTLRYWNVKDGKSAGSLVAHPGPISAVAFNVGGSTVFTTGIDGSLRFWNLPVLSKPLTPEFKDPITALGLSPDNAQLLAASDRVVRLSSTASLKSSRDFTGATGDIRTVTSLPAASLVAAGCDDGKLIVWRGKDGVPLMQLPVHTGSITGVAFNPAGNQLASVGKDGLLHLWSIPPAEPRAVLHTENVTAAALSGDGLRLLTAAADKSLRLFKLDNLKTPERQFTGHPGAIQSVALSADGKSLLSGSDDGIIRLWSSTKAEPLGQIGGHTGAIASLQQIGIDRILSASADGTVKLWQVAPAVKNANLSHAGAVSSATLSADGLRLVTGCADKQVRLWTLASGAVERTLPGPTLGVLSVAISPRGDRVAAGSADKSVFVWETTGKVAQKFTTLPAAVQGVAFAADGKQVVAALADGSVRVLDVTTGKELRALTAHTMSANSVFLTLRGDQVVSAGADGLIQVTPLAGGAAATTIKHGSPISTMALTRDSARVAVGGADKIVKVYSLPAGKLEATIATPAEVRGLAFSGDGKRLAVAGSDGKARLYSAAGTFEEFFAQEGSVNAVVFSSDGKRLISAGADKMARIFSPALVWQVKHEGGARQALLISRGDRVVSAGADGLVLVSNASDGKPIQTLRTHTGAVAGIAVWPDGSKVVASGESAARLYDLSKLLATKTGGKDLDKPTLEMALPAKGEALTCCLSPSGLRIAVGVAIAGKEQVRIFDSATGKELLALGAADGMPGRTLTFLPDSRSLMAAGTDKSVRLTDVNILTSLEVHPGGCTGVAWHSNGSQLLTGGADKKVKLWSLPAGKLDRTFGPLDEAVNGIAFARDHSQVAAIAGKALRVWATADAKPIVTKEMPSAGSGVNFNSDKTRLAVASEDGQARIFDAVTGNYLQGFSHGKAVSGVVFAPSAPTVLYTSSADRSASQHTLTARAVFTAGSPLAALAVAPNSAQVATAGGDGKVRLYNATSGVLDRTIEASEKAQTCVAFSRNSVLVAAGGSDNKVRLFNVADGKPVLTITMATAPRSLGFHPNNKMLVMAGADGSIVAWDATYNPGQVQIPEFGKVLQTFRHATEAFEVGFSNSTTSMIVFSAGADPSIKAWRLASETATRNFGHPSSVNSVAFNKDGTVIASGCGDGQIRLFDLAKGALTRTIKAHPGQPNNPAAIYTVAFSPDNKTILSASYDQTLKLWNVADGTLVREFKAFKEKTFEKGHQEAVLCAAFSPDGKQIASGGMDRSIKIWNVATGAVDRELTNPAHKPPTAHPGWVYALHWIDGGKKLVSAGGAPRVKGYLATWDMTTAKLLSGQELAVGTIFAMNVSADEKFIGLGTGGSLRSEKDYNTGLILKLGK